MTPIFRFIQTARKAKSVAACLATLCCALASASFLAHAQDLPGTEGWIPLFNGKNLDGWKPKIKGYDAGDNFGNTFRVEDGVLKVVYDHYPRFDNRVRPPLFRAQVLELSPADRVPVCRRPVPWRAGLGDEEQRRHDPQPVARLNGQGPGLPGLHRGSVSRRQRQGQSPDGQRLHAGHQHRDARTS